MTRLLPLLLLALSFVAASASERAALDEDFGYVTVRPGAHMFWVMYHTEQEGDYTQYPLILWLQGGPGASGVGYGNFMELGPTDINGNSRPYAWTKRANLMFVDNPVGTGYSYVENFNDLTTDNTQIANDLVTVVKEAFKVNQDMEKMPFFVYAESYGGKMTVDFALAFDQAIKNGEVVSDFRGVALGDSWISPMDSVNTWGMFLYQMGFVNRQGMKEIDDAAAKAQDAVDAGQWDDATDRWSDTEFVVMTVAHDVNFYNVLAEDDIYRDTKIEPHSRDFSYMSPAVRRLYDHHVKNHYNTKDLLDDFMNGPQADHWNIPSEVKWDSQGGYVFSYLAGDFMKPVVDSVVQLLTETDIHVAVFTGDLDLICDTPGTYKWIEDMQWPDKPNFNAAKTVPIHITAYSSPAAFVQSSGQFSVYTILRSGHMVPIDAPEMALKMIDLITSSASSKAKEDSSESAEKKTTNPEQVKEEPTKQEPKEEPTKPEPKEEPTKPEAVKVEAPQQNHEKAKPKTLQQRKPAINKPRSRVAVSHLNPATPTGKRFAKMMAKTKAAHGKR